MLLRQTFIVFYVYKAQLAEGANVKKACLLIFCINVKKMLSFIVTQYSVAVTKPTVIFFLGKEKF